MARGGFLAGSLAAYGLLYVALHPFFGAGMAVFSFIPVLLGGVQLGFWGGLSSSLAAMLTNALLFLWLDGAQFSSVMGHGAAVGSLALAMGGATVGWLRDVHIREETKLAENRRMGKALQESEEKFRYFVEQSSDGIILADEQGKLIEWNQGMEKITGLRRVEAVGKALWEVQYRFVPDEMKSAAKLEALKSAAQQMLATGKSPFANRLTEGHLQLEDGSRRTVQEVSFPIQTEKGYMLGSVIREVGEQIRAQEALRESKALFQSLVETLPQNIFRKDREGRITFANQRYCQVHGKTLEQVLGATDFDLHPAELAEKFQAEDRQVMESQRVHESVSEIRRAEGGNSFVQTIKTPIYDAQGQVCGVQGISWDISERMRVERSEGEQRELAEALRETAAILNSTLRFDEVLEKILANAGRVASHDAANITLIESGQAYVASCAGYQDRIGEEDLKALRFPVEDTPNLRQMARSGRPLVIEDTRQYEGWVDYPETAWTRSYAGTPILIKGRVVGFLNLDSATAGHFGPEHGERLQAFANQAATAIENARLFESVQRQARQMALVNEITRAANRAASLEEMTRSLALRLGELIEADTARILIWDEARQEATSGGGKAEEVETRMAVEALEGGLPLVFEQAKRGAGAERREAAASGKKPVLGLPLVADGHGLGTALIGFERPHHFTPEEMALCTQAADQLALALAKTQLLEAEQERSRQLSRANALILALGHVAAQIENAPDPDGVMKTLGAELKKLGVQCLVTLQKEGTPYQSVRYLSFDSKLISLAEKLAGIKVEDFVLTPDHFPYYDDIVQERRPVFTPDATPAVTAALPGLPQPLARHIARMFGVDSRVKNIYLPLTVEEQVLGFLWMWGENLEESDLPAVSIFASQVAVALENAQLMARIQQLAITDDLTGLYNRRGLFELGRREVERATRFDRPLSAILMDIDDFKLVNDRYGHAAGDQVLHELGQRCSTLIRDVDIAGRYGGEEFVILLPENDLASAAQVAERLRTAAAQTPFTTDKGKVSITISLGVVTASARTRDLDQLVEEADKAMYAAKREGKNRVRN